jgi:uncharacterized protein
MFREKLDNLIETLKGMESALLAYSGGLDSTFLLKAVKLSGIRATAVTSHSETTPEHDLNDAKRMAKEIGIEHRIIRTSELQNENFVNNPPDRCFYCKDELFKELKAIAKAEGFKYVLDGSNLDDKDDFRPGRQAAKKHGVRSPLMETGFTKQDIRDASKALGLPTWNKPASPCLSTRFPYGMRITKEALNRVASAEKLLRAMGFSELRVRDHGEIARIEVSESRIPDILKIREKVIEEFKQLGYKFVSLDLEGLTSGSMNRLLR